MPHQPVLVAALDPTFELAHPGAPVALAPGPDLAEQVELRRAGDTPSNVGRGDRPSSACQSSGGRSSRATTIPT